MRIATRPDNPIDLFALLARQVPEALIDGFLGFMQARAIMAGISLGVFAALAEQPDDAEGLAQRLELDPKGTDALLIALHSCAYLDQKGTRYSPSGKARRNCLRSSPVSLVDWSGGFAYDMWDHFGQLEDCVRTGKPIGLHERPEDDPYWARYMRGLFDLSKLAAPVVSKMIPARSPRSLLDLAGGHGGYAIELCRRHPGLRATILELEGAARIGRELVAEAGMGDRIDYVVGDIFESDLGEHDIVTAHQILHHCTPEQCVTLLRRAREALRPGGALAVMEEERPADGERGAQSGALTGLLFFITSAVRTYTAAELEGFAREAGFGEPKVKRDPRIPGQVVLLATR